MKAIILVKYSYNSVNWLISVASIGGSTTKHFNLQVTSNLVFQWNFTWKYIVCI